MLASILRTLGLAPFRALLESESELIAVKGEVRKLQDAIAAKRDDFGALEQRAVKVAERSAKIIRAIDESARYPAPFFSVLDQPKKLTLSFMRSTADPSPVIVKSSVRNNANVKHFNELRDALNKLVGEFGEGVRSPIHDATTDEGGTRTGRHVNPHAGIPMTDKPTKR